MADRYVFADEAGNFDFSLGRSATRYYVLTTVTMDDTNVGDAVLSLRRELAWRGFHLDQVFHATTDPQSKCRSCGWRRAFEQAHKRERGRRHL